MDLPPIVPRQQKPCFLVTCLDGKMSAENRRTHLEGHLHHVEQNWRSYITAGPIRNPGGEEIIGSVFLILADTLEDAKTLMQRDPYITCGMYETIDYHDFTNSIGLFPGGKIWEDVASIKDRATGGPSQTSST